MFSEHQAALLQQKREFDEDKEKIEVRILRTLTLTFFNSAN